MVESDTQFVEARRRFEQDGVCILRNVLPPEQVAQLREALVEIFTRDAASQRSVGTRTDMTAAAERIIRAGHGNRLLADVPKGSGAAGRGIGGSGGGRYLTEIDAGRWHRGIRQFELFSDLPPAVAQVLGEGAGRYLRFFGDHIFLKEAGSALRTGWHQDTPYFPFHCDASDADAKAAVCWVPVDEVTSDSGGMRYVKGSHRWREHEPNVLIARDALDADSHSPAWHAFGVAPPLPDIDAGEEQGLWEIVSFASVGPGDVVIHHPNCVHGSAGNISAGQRRLAASIRYVGDGVRWRNKPTLVAPRRYAKVWAIPRLRGPGMVARAVARRAAWAVGMLSDEEFYEEAHVWAMHEMRDGDAFDAREVGKIAFPIVWRRQGRSGD